MLSHNAVLKGDIVYYLHRPTKSAYIGSVIASDVHPARNSNEVTHDKCENENTVICDLYNTTEVFSSLGFLSRKSFASWFGD